MTRSHGHVDACGTVSAASAADAPLATGVATIAGAALGARIGTGFLRAHPPAGAARWSRTNHAGREISLLEGPGYITGAVLGVLAGGHRTNAVPAAIAAVGSGVFGLLDDLAGDATSKGLRGHLGALRAGRVTTGAVKIVGLAATGALTAYVLEARASGGAAPGSALTRGRALRALTATILGGAVIAGSANLANLLDLRPGRTLKVASLVAAPLAVLGDPAAGAALGAALGCLPDDLAGLTMLGDTGANAAGALVGAAVVTHTGPLGRALVLACLAGLTLASERVSFTAVIESTPVLREIDAWGRR